MRILKSKFSQQPRRNKGETEDLLIRRIALQWHLKNLERRAFRAICFAAFLLGAFIVENIFLAYFCYVFR